MSNNDFITYFLIQTKCDLLVARASSVSIMRQILCKIKNVFVFCICHRNVKQFPS